MNTKIANKKMIAPANRLSDVSEYYFSQKLQEVAAMKASGIDVINMGIGSPDLAPHPSVIQALHRSSSLAHNHGYQNYHGIPALREAISEFYQKHFTVKLNPDGEILPMMGSKEAIMHISMAFLNPGDKVLVPNPGYPTYTSVTKLVGAQTIYYDLKADSNWLPDIAQLETLAKQDIKLMWVNYPHMPTGAKASLADLESLVRFAQKHNILLVNDNPYSFVLNQSPVSVLAVEGAMRHCLELNSLSKSFNMAGWRVGMLCGAKEFLLSVVKVKSNMDSGMFLGIQEGAVAALQLDLDWFAALNQIYEKRRKLVWQLCDQLGASYQRDTSGMFVWAKLDHNLDAKAYVDRLLQERHIFIAPGDIFGSNGKGYIRFSLCVKEDAIQKALQRTKSFSPHNA
ncbi:MAG TPA: aminotransferase class I/II-fold pyridoxal phosphate-dependent enzyme [Cyclobacteriaceae bacterium]|nr:aminotransferase class I/II-fold pyridoxal phosphate-dependent enzyme [Cyclobacteriaceae bacterium]